VIRSRAFGWRLRQADFTNKTEDEIQEIKELSVRAVHSLGLDFGVANMARSLDGKYYVLDVDANCRWMTEECKDAYISEFISMLSRYDRQGFGMEDVTIGSDIECIIKYNDSGSIIFASDFLQKEGCAGLDNRSIEEGQKHFPLLEIRPVYSINPIEVSDSIGSILENVSENICYLNTGIYAGSMPVYNYWTGGHIHFGIKPCSKLLKALDNYLALILMMVEKVYTARSRKTKYGELGNFRLKPHGFEYRSLSSFILSPEITRAVLCLAKVIVQEYLNFNPAFINNLDDLTAYYSVDKGYFSVKIRSIIGNIERSETFELYRSFIEPLFSKALVCEEWDEDKPINEAWGIKSNGRIFRSWWKCFVPKRKREQLGIGLDDKVNVKIGGQEYSLWIYPKDDFSSDKSGYVSFTDNVCENTGISETDSIGMWLDLVNGTLRAGPVLGILAVMEHNEYGLFGMQSAYFKKLIKVSKSKGMIVFVFTIFDIEWEKYRVKGYTYDFIKDDWAVRYFPTPDIIYERGNTITIGNYGQHAFNYLNNTRRMKIKFINNPESRRISNDRWRIYQFLSSDRELRKYLPRTIRLKQDEQIFECLEDNNEILIKPVDEVKGEEVFSVRRTGENDFIVVHQIKYSGSMKYKANKKNLIRIINDLIDDTGHAKDDFVIQCLRSPLQYKGTDFEVRVVMQKNSSGKWFRTYMVSRYWGDDGYYITIPCGTDMGIGETLGPDTLIKNNDAADRIRKVSKNIVMFMNDNGMQIGEVSMDFSVGEDLSVSLVDIELEPDNLLSTIGALKTMNLTVNRILEYSRCLVLKKPVFIKNSKSIRE
jgi:hypothetical protein